MVAGIDDIPAEAKALPDQLWFTMVYFDIMVLSNS